MVSLVWLFSVFLLPGCILATHLAIPSLKTCQETWLRITSCHNLALNSLCASWLVMKVIDGSVNSREYWSNTPPFPLVKLFWESRNQGEFCKVKYPVWKSQYSVGRDGNALFTFLFEFPRLPRGKFLLKVKPAPVGDGAEAADRQLTCFCRSAFLAFCTIGHT